MMWLALIFTFLLIEGITLNLVTIWFAVGALCAFVTSYFTNSIMIQLIVFIIFTTLSLLFTRPLLNKYVKRNIKNTNIDMTIGKIGIVTQDISPLKNGRVNVLGKSWMATSSNEIKKGTKVEVLEIQGAKIIVKEKES